MTELQAITDVVQAIEEYSVYALDNLTDLPEWRRVAIGVQQGESRWHATMWNIYEAPSGALFAVEWYSGLTEMQESFHEGIVHEVERYEVTEIRYRGVGR